MSVWTVALAVAGAFFMLAFLIGTYVTWQALGVLKWDKFVFDPDGHPTRVLRFLLSLMGGFFVGATAAAYSLAWEALRQL
ncbi:hypothetical protein GCM10025857_23050 [Alicyclobacillus contaminans]|uniref:DUF1146 domain-containing protein n=1 Tax=Alicyclobacillus contaminans TaxID=392016 RepID=UPI000424B5D8|nr:DUF1146 domain-containing protein [Alicyclobacillus contaminans]GMA50948.1 hypothetical protein GCM10025857_23050 [Alicyclobacillus contaminans]